MSNTFVTVIAVVLSAVLIFVFPVMGMANRQDATVKADIQAKVNEFADEVKTTGKLTEDNYNKFLQKIGATGNVYSTEMEFKILDENPGKKSLQTATDKIGENVYYSVFTSQIEEEIKNNKKYLLKDGDIIAITVKNTNLTTAQQLANFIYKTLGNDTYTILASGGGMVTTTAKQ